MNFFHSRTRTPRSSFHRTHPDGVFANLLAATFSEPLRRSHPVGAAIVEYAGTSSAVRIRELKQDFGLDAFCLQDFWATEASFRFIMATYNLIILFRHCAPNSHNTATLASLRSYCFAIGAWVSQHARQRVLKLSLPSSKRP